MSERIGPRMERTDSWGEPALKVLCPVCGYSYQHHAEVFVFERENGEDGPTMVLATGRHVEAITAGNPSPRRNAVRIFFEGECGHLWHLDLIQHKGETFVFAKLDGEVKS